MSTSSAPASEAGSPDAPEAGNSSQCTRPPSRLCRVTTPSCSRLKGGNVAACSSVKLSKNAANSGWRNSESCPLIVMMPSSARAPVRGARRSRVSETASRDPSMLNPDAPDCNPRNAEIGRGAKTQKQTSPKNVRCTLSLLERNFVCTVLTSYRSDRITLRDFSEFLNLRAFFIKVDPVQSGTSPMSVGF